jgi:transcriptional regulator with XRE-family HTH domain
LPIQQNLVVPDPVDPALAQVGPRLKRLRQEREITLATLAQRTRISLSTLSRLESGLRRPTIELLVPIARVFQVSLDDLVGTQAISDPRVHATAMHVGDTVVLPLTRQSGALQAFKMTIPAVRRDPTPRSHTGYEWLYVLSGRLRVVLGEQEFVMKPGEAAEFDTRVPHLFMSATERPVEVLVLFGPQGERMHVRVKPRGK